jgi:hypothetical protein
MKSRHSLGACALVGLLFAASCVTEPTPTSPLWGRWTGTTEGSPGHAPTVVIVKLVAEEEDWSIEAIGSGSLTTPAGDTLTTCPTVYGYRGVPNAALTFLNCSGELDQIEIYGILSTDGGSIEGVIRGAGFKGEPIRLSKARP